MKLSEAIRAGSDDVEENHMDYLWRDYDGNWCGCALGTALFALEAARLDYVQEEDHVSGIMVYKLLELDIPGLEDEASWPADFEPYSGEPPFIPLIKMVDILHSRYQWSRDDIATWLESIGR